MKTFYVDSASQAMLDMVGPGELGRHWTIAQITVPKSKRGQGVGARLLDRVLADADAEGVVLEGQIQEGDGLTSEQLMAWYRRRGFRHVGWGLMVRKPKAPVNS